MKGLLKELRLALDENTISLSKERRISLQIELMACRMEIMKSMIKIQDEMLAEASREHKEAA